MNRTLAAMLTVTLCTVGAWSAGTWHGSRARVEAAPALAAPSNSPAPNLAIVPDDPSTVPDERVSDTSAERSNLPVPLLDESAPEADVDLYGNEVSSAVATYTSDRTGSVYEEHSPHTEVPRLAPPST